MDDRVTLRDFLTWLEGLADGSILFTGRYAHERSATRVEQGAQLSEEAEQWLTR